VTYAIGDQVEGYVLTEQGWVPRLELDPSPFRPGHVVNDAILTGALEWQPLRVAPDPPYRVGDVVEGYVLVPSGDWLPLPGQVRDRSGAALSATAVPAGPAAPKAQRTASARTTQTQTQPQPRAQTHQPRTQTSSAQTASPQPRRVSSPAPARYRVGQVVDGHLLTADRGWVPLSQVQRRPAPAAGRPAAKSGDTTGRVLLAVIGVIVLILLRSCG
jgi:hypothetical protein